MPSPQIWQKLLESASLQLLQLQQQRQTLAWMMPAVASSATRLVPPVAVVAVQAWQVLMVEIEVCLATMGLSQMVAVVAVEAEATTAMQDRGVAPAAMIHITLAMVAAAMAMAAGPMAAMVTPMAVTVTPMAATVTPMAATVTPMAPAPVTEQQIASSLLLALKASRLMLQLACQQKLPLLGCLMVEPLLNSLLQTSPATAQQWQLRR
jgi:hypothetical protein